MLYVLFYVCSINLGKCNQEYLKVSEETLTPTTCLMYAQPQLARWNQWHPNKKVTKWKCVSEERLNKELEREL